MRAVNDFENGMTYLYISGSALQLGSENVGGSTNTTAYEYEGELYLGAYAFRVPDAKVALFRIGSENKSGVSFSVKELTITQNNAPVIAEAAADNAEVTLVDGTASVQISATVLGADDFTVSCTQEGASVSGKTVSFTQEGEYTVTVTAQNEFGTVTKTVTVNVKAAAQTGE